MNFPFKGTLPKVVNEGIYFECAAFAQIPAHLGTDQIPLLALPGAVLRSWDLEKCYTAD